MPPTALRTTPRSVGATCGASCLLDGSRLMGGPPSGGEALQCVAQLALAQALERTVPQLAHTLACDAQHVADLLQRVLAAALETEVQAQHARIARGQRVQRAL